MTQTATVEKLLGDGEVLLSVVRQTACGHNCEQCAGCGVQAGALRITAVDRIGGLHVGEKVVVSSADKQVLGIAALVYLLPVAAFLAGYLGGEALSARFASGAAAVHAAVTAIVTALGCLPAFFREKRLRRQGRLSFEIIGRL